MSNAAESATGGVKSARRVLDVLELLAANPDGLAFPEIGERLGLPKSSLHALLWTLVDRRWIVLDGRRRCYRIGVRVWEAGQGFQGAVNLARTAQPHLQAVRDELDETVQLAILDGLENVYIAKVEADQPLRLVSRVGMRLPAYATGLGKVLLAYLEPAELAQRLDGVRLERFTDRTAGTAEELVARLAEIRERGYGEDDGEYTPGLVCLAAPVRDHTGAVVAALSCSVPSARLDRLDIDRGHIRDAVVKHARDLSTDLGWPG
ncbi:IclR family transcriptional regulator [Rhizomonospora bruguierae]|uniref:IclR family transcriptional regulator n=1 Tax=Rhizomonospora bruguierae TaxID=1581705 RepID=UPI001BCE6974|nr:IclR family transcriptional regulator [Micromonospora sp. NBRC 107566]